MKFDRMGLGLVAMMLSVVACVDSANDVVDVDEGNLTSSAEKPAVGTYLNLGGECGGNLQIESFDDEGMTFALYANCGTSAGDVSGTAVFNGGAWVFEDEGSDCVLELRPGTESITVRQTGTCGFAMGVEADGTYKFSARAADPALGEYVLDLPERSGTLTITKLELGTLEFSISVANNEPPYNSGQTELLNAWNQFGAWVFDDLEANDCKLVIEVDGDQLDVTQEGSCGFGNGVYADGSYKKR